MSCSSMGGMYIVRVEFRYYTFHHTQLYSKSVLLQAIKLQHNEADADAIAVINYDNVKISKTFILMLQLHL